MVAGRSDIGEDGTFDEWRYSDELVEREFEAADTARLLVQPNGSY